jgi:hypothetical protein
MGKPKTPLEKPRSRWVDNICMDFVEIGRGGVDCIALTEIRNSWITLVKVVMDLRVP